MSDGIVRVECMIVGRKPEIGRLVSEAQISGFDSHSLCILDLYSTTQYNLQRGSILFILEGCEGVQTLRGCRRMKSLQWVGCTRGDCAIEFSVSVLYHLEIDLSSP